MTCIHKCKLLPQLGAADSYVCKGQKTSFQTKPKKKVEPKGARPPLKADL